LEQDEKLAEKSGDLSDKKWYSLLVRMEEKLALSNALASIQPKTVPIGETDETSFNTASNENFVKKTISKKRKKPSKKRNQQK